MSTASILPEALLQLDQALFQQVKDLEILESIAPLNYRQQKQDFFASGYRTTPDFIYRDHQLDIFSRKRALLNLPVESLPDDDLVKLYSDVILSYVDKLDQIDSVGTPEFLYNCLRYYGEPTEKDIRNAQFILHLPGDDLQEPLLDANTMAASLQQFAEAEGYQYEVILDSGMIANALVSGTRVKINTAARVSATELQALAHHELGVHLVTTLNARRQPLQVLSLGCPLNTLSQEGMAIFCEYRAGCMTLPRLRVLALRVIAVHSMIKEKDFKRTFALLREQYQAADDLAFTITARVYRGGGFTKDYLYLQGLHQILNAYEQADDFELLLCGKVHVDYVPLLRRLINNQYLSEPHFISPAIRQPADIDPVQSFIAHAIK